MGTGERKVAAAAGEEILRHGLSFQGFPVGAHYGMLTERPTGNYSSRRDDQRLESEHPGGNGRQVSHRQGGGGTRPAQEAA